MGHFPETWPDIDHYDYDYKKDDNKNIKEIHIHHHHYYPVRQQSTYPYPYPWHSILPRPTYYADWYYQPTYTTTTGIRGTQRYDSI